METVKKIGELKTALRAAKTAGKSIGFVPTMGYFHQGHLSLMQRARQENDVVVVSLFVNPTQFGAGEDLEKYPHDLGRDQAMAVTTGVDYLFCPEASAMYPRGFQTTVEVAQVAQGLCGASRPGHFRGVATVVLKLLQIVAPDRAYFGEKDAQQLRVIRQMVRDLNLDVSIVGCPIIRETDGLALSSRNVYLNPAERQAALVLNRSLTEAARLIQAGERESEPIIRAMLGMIRQEPLALLDYAVVASSDSLEPVQTLAGEIIIALAVTIGATRLIDNRVFQLGECG
jgi:pantoate--beta-alanine ligase